MFCDTLKGRDGMRGGKEIREGGDVCIHMTDSCYMAEAKRTF